MKWSIVSLIIIILYKLCSYPFGKLVKILLQKSQIAHQNVFRFIRNTK